MFNLGFGGQFGGGFLQSPDAASSAPSGVVTYAANVPKSRPRDDSQRRDRYGSLDSWGLSFPVSFNPGSNRQRRY